MPKQYRVIRRTELVSSYIIEVPDGTDEAGLDELLLDNYEDGWPKYIIREVYEDDPHGSTVVETYSLKEPIDADAPLGESWRHNDDELVFQDWD